MQLHQLKPKTKRKASKRVGRGGKRGTYSGRGQKGQKARAGRKMRPQLRDIIKRIPKKRGYRFKPLKEKPAAVNLGAIEKVFKAGESVSPETLLEKKLIRRRKGKASRRIKILAGGELKKKISFSGCEFSSAAAKKIHG